MLCVVQAPWPPSSRCSSRGTCWTRVHGAKPCARCYGKSLAFGGLSVLLLRLVPSVSKPPFSKHSLNVSRFGERFGSVLRQPRVQCVQRTLPHLVHRTHYRLRFSLQRSAHALRVGNHRCHSLACLLGLKTLQGLSPSAYLWRREEARKWAESERACWICSCSCRLRCRSASKSCTLLAGESSFIHSYYRNAPPCQSRQTRATALSAWRTRATSVHSKCYGHLDEIFSYIHVR